MAIPHYNCLVIEKPCSTIIADIVDDVTSIVTSYFQSRSGGTFICCECRRDIKLDKNSTFETLTIDKVFYNRRGPKSRWSVSFLICSNACGDAYEDKHKGDDMQWLIKMCRQARRPYQCI